MKQLQKTPAHKTTIDNGVSWTFTRSQTQIDSHPPPPPPIGGETTRMEQVDLSPHQSVCGPKWGMCHEVYRLSAQVALTRNRCHSSDAPSPCYMVIVVARLASDPSPRSYLMDVRTFHRTHPVVAFATPNAHRSLVIPPPPGAQIPPPWQWPTCGRSGHVTLAV